MEPVNSSKQRAVRIARHAGFSIESIAAERGLSCEQVRSILAGSVTFARPSIDSVLSIQSTAVRMMKAAQSIVLAGPRARAVRAVKGNFCDVIFPWREEFYRD